MAAANNIRHGAEYHESLNRKTLAFFGSNSLCEKRPQHIG
jgi:hypothetical protein